MIPATRNGLPAMACVIAMQKAIRRGLEREAMEFAVELIHTSRAFHSMVCNRLEIICHEDLDTVAAPWVVPFVAAALAQSKERYSKSIGEARLMVGNAIRMMCRAPKSRAGCHFARGDRSAVDAGGLRSGHSRLGERSAHLQVASWAVGSIISASRARSWSRRRPNSTIRGRSLPTLGAQAAGQVISH